MAVAAKELKMYAIRRPHKLGVVGMSSALVSRAGIDGDAIQQLGKKGTRQTIRGTAYFLDLKNAQAYRDALPDFFAIEARIIDNLNAIDIQGLIHNIDPTEPYAVIAYIGKKLFTYAIDLEIDYTRTK